MKGLVFKGPRGYNLLAEVDYFYPLPDSVAALKPKRTKLKPVPAPLPPKTPPPPPPTTEAIPTFPENHILYDHPVYEDHHPDLYVPDSGWKVDPDFGSLPDVPPGKEIPEGVVPSDRVWRPQATVSGIECLLLLELL